MSNIIALASRVHGCETPLVFKSSKTVNASFRGLVLLVTGTFSNS